MNDHQLNRVIDATLALHHAMSDVGISMEGAVISLPHTAMDRFRRELAEAPALKSIPASAVKTDGIIIAGVKFNGV